MLKGYYKVAPDLRLWVKKNSKLEPIQLTQDSAELIKDFFKASTKVVWLHSTSAIEYFNALQEQFNDSCRINHSGFFSYTEREGWLYEERCILATKNLSILEVFRHLQATGVLPYSKPRSYFKGKITVYPCNSGDYSDIYHDYPEYFSTEYKICPNDCQNKYCPINDRTDFYAN